MIPPQTLYKIICLHLVDARVKHEGMHPIRSPLCSNILLHKTRIYDTTSNIISNHLFIKLHKIGIYDTASNIIQDYLLVNLPYPAHPAGFSFCNFAGFLAIFNVVKSQQQNKHFTAQNSYI